MNSSKRKGLGQGLSLFGDEKPKQKSENNKNLLAFQLVI